AGKEASGTGNMKFAMNGALTLGTLDGANIEIREEVGADNFFLFGLTAEEISAQRSNHNPQAILDSDEDLKGIFDLLKCGHFNPLEPGIFDNILRDLTEWGDYWMVIADLADYLRAQAEVDKAYLDRDAWVKSSILNAAHSGKFSTDRTMNDYNRDIWHLDAVKPSLAGS
ncbi:MAG: glycogen/starch/alpha-glucan phosphorylase, partial [Erythrobacter sp.]|nr:glycogen/starch/alpha-glucan phosphorylase [Erythrobacter sp.]